MTSITAGNRLAWTIRPLGFFTHGNRRLLRSRPTVFSAILDHHFQEIRSREYQEWRKAALAEDRAKRCKGTKPDGSPCCAYRAKGEEFCRHHG